MIESELPYLVGTERTTLVIRPALGYDEVISDITIPLGGDFTDDDVEVLLHEMKVDYYRATRKRVDTSWGGASGWAEVILQVFANASDETFWIVFGLALDRLLDRFGVQAPMPSAADSLGLARTHVATKYGVAAGTLALAGESEDVAGRMRTYLFDGQVNRYEIDVRSTAKGFAYVSRSSWQSRFPDAVG